MVVLYGLYRRLDVLVHRPHQEYRCAGMPVLTSTSLQCNSTVSLSCRTDVFSSPLLHHGPPSLSLPLGLSPSLTHGLSSRYWPSLPPLCRYLVRHWAFSSSAAAPTVHRRRKAAESGGRNNRATFGSDMVQQTRVSRPIKTIHSDIGSSQERGGEIADLHPGCCEPWEG